MSFGDFNNSSSTNNANVPTANQAALGLSTAPFSDGDVTANARALGTRPIQLTRTTATTTTTTSSSTTRPASTSPDKIVQGRQLWDRASNSVFQISNNVASLDALVKLLGTNRDTHDLRARLHELTENTRDMIKQTGADLKALVIPENASNFEGRQHKMAQQKLQKDFESVLARFQGVSKMAARKSQEYVQKAKQYQQKQQHLHDHENDENEDPSENAPLLQQQQEASLDMEVEYNESLIQEREQDLQNIERSIIEVNEIFRDLGTIVGEQQFMLDHIESNVGSVSVHVEGATNELRVAAERQKAAQNRMCCLYTVLGAIGLVVILVNLLFVMTQFRLMVCCRLFFDDRGSSSTAVHLYVSYAILNNIFTFGVFGGIIRFVSNLLVICHNTKASFHPIVAENEDTKNFPKNMIFRTLLITTGFGVAATYALTTQLESVPLGSLLARKQESWRTQFPGSNLPTDAFQLRIPRSFLKSIQPVEIEEFATAFATSPVFSLERFLIKTAGLANSVTVPTTFEKGDRMALWTVDGKNHGSKELFMTWEAKGSPFSGSTWLRVVDEEEGGKSNVLLQFGSGLNVPKTRDVSASVMQLHFLYSRVLLVNTAATLVFRRVVG
ncbi:UNVERIFIED_CONTAM: hypothetical protein HDU68_007715 [Siphonaria sp. JEL0065]|nr:hypothetical protein HDU68_007715 [Siphonaria sp. JEL0065]